MRSQQQIAQDARVEALAAAALVCREKAEHKRRVAKEWDRRGLDIEAARAWGAASALEMVARLIETEGEEDAMETQGNVAQGYQHPRRNRVDNWEPAERAIQAAVDEVEKGPADPRLTEAVILLQKARELVADVVDERIGWYKEGPTESQEQAARRIFLRGVTMQRDSDSIHHGGKKQHECHCSIQDNPLVEFPT